jgi:hypothetical protein
MRDHAVFHYGVMELVLADWNNGGQPKLERCANKQTCRIYCYTITLPGDWDNLDWKQHIRLLIFLVRGGGVLLYVGILNAFVIHICFFLCCQKFIFRTLLVQTYITARSKGISLKNHTHLWFRTEHALLSL